MKRERITYLVIIAVLIAVILLMRSCKSNPCPEVIKTVTTTDTIKGKSDTVYKPVPVQVISYVPVPVKQKSIDAVADPTNNNPVEVTPPNTAADYAVIPDYPVNIYADTLWFKMGDTLRGFALVRDTVQASEITGRSYKYELYNKTVTNNLQERKRNRYFIGAEIFGNQNSPLKYLGADIALQGKRTGRIYIIGAGLMNSQAFYKAGMLFPIN